VILYSVQCYALHWTDKNVRTNFDPSTPCPEKNVPYIFNCNIKQDDQISIIFDINIYDITCGQMIVQFSTAPICFCTTWETKSTKYCIFILFRLFGFSQLKQKQALGEVETKTVV